MPDTTRDCSDDCAAERGATARKREEFHRAQFCFHSGLHFRNCRTQMNRAVFLDRDGTIIAEQNYIHRPEDVEIFPGAGAALKRLQDAGFKLFVVSNQSGVGRGYFTLEDVERVNAHLRNELAKDGVRFEKIYIAPEAPEQPSRGRKPSPQFLFDARDEFNLNLSQSYMIGDKLIDLKCGWNAGVKKSILVRTGYGAKTEQELGGKTHPALIVDDLSGTLIGILQENSRLF
jgi:D-glycero-D-manno-heptose 1,7-bisphosphate phosphatase